MIRGFNLKLVAICLMTLFIFQIAFPTLSFALTGGPSSPSQSAFTPVGASELVDLNTGDFSYNIPLMTVPGPNGGYPINIGYKGGVTMEQEASWVGLGWDLNVGAITRNLRGLPDDFNGKKGDKVTQTLSYKPTVITSATFATSKVGIKFKKKLFGKDVSINGANFTVGYNNYTGISGGAGSSMAIGNFNFSANFDSKDGISVSPSYDLSHALKFLKRPFRVSAGFSTSAGFSSINFSRTNLTNKELQAQDKTTSSITAGVSFAKTSPIGDISSAQDITTTHLGMGIGDYVTPKFTEKLNFKLANTTITLKAKTKNVPAYGYMHLEDADEKGLMDFHKENELGVYDESPVLPMPILDNDIYSISGQGISGSFRTYRGDIPMLQPHQVKSNKTTIGATGEYGASRPPLIAGNHIGGDVLLGGGESITGKWGVNNLWYPKGEISKLEKDIRLKGKDTKNPLYEPFYFDYMGKQSMSDDDYYEDIEKNSPVGYDVSLSKRMMIEGMWAKTGQLSSSSFNRGIKTNANRKRNINTNHIGYYTKKDINKSQNYHTVTNDIATQPLNEYHQEVSKGNDDHIHEINVTNTSGTKYVYGIPVYSSEKEDVMFSVDPKSINESRIPFDANDATDKNKKGKEHFYKSTKVDDYAHSYLLTQTLSDDYVDLTQDGPSDDDFGYWCKFEYDKVSDYNWRAPFYGANYVEGNHSNKKDDKASFTYGKKEQYFLNKIETKTHKAIFYADDRRDNCGANNRDQVTNTTGARSKKLYKIELYSKKDLSTPIKTIEFYYDYSQCKGIENYSNISGDSHIIQGANNDGGKLTLRKVVILNQDNNKGELAPYEFDYGNGAAQGAKGNSNYQYLTNTDRWGMNQDIPSGYASSKFFPYTNQYMTETTRSQYASNWNLTEIKLPSKGKIKIDYESDDYAKTQDKKANQMFELIGFGLTEHPDLSETKRIRKFNEIDGVNRYTKEYVLFKKTDGTDFKNDIEVNQCIKGLQNVYFKSYVELKNKTPEFVSGYLKVNTGYSAHRHFDDNSVGVFMIQDEEYSRLNQDINAVQKIACQDYHSRVDLQGAIQSPIKQLRILIDGPVAYYKSMGIGREMSKERKSILRLNPDNKKVYTSDYLPKQSGKTYGYDAKKYGGGIRVKSVTVETGWGETYGQKYSYVKENGKTSGVADYEPGIGSEENSLKKPVVYTKVLDYNSSYGNDEFFTEGPFSEAFYPSPIVRYSRVITENIEPKDIDRTTAGRTSTLDSSFEASNLGGITVNGYYTSEDFPVKEKYTPMDKSKTKPRARYAIPLPFGLDKASKVSKVFSQGYVVELNDMAGKPKYVATFNYADKLNKNLKLSSAKTKVEYKYHTDKNDEKTLNSKVLVLTQDREFSEQTIGRKEEFYVYQHENLDYNKVYNVNASIGFTGSPTPPEYIYAQFSRNRSIKQRRILVTNKVVYHTGVLKEVVTNDNGRVTTSKNLAYDAFTGEALVQTQENDWDKPVYSYNYAGNWKYPELGGKYQNYRAYFKVTGTSPNYKIDASNVNVSDILQLGDILTIPQSSVKNDNVYVTGIDLANNTFEARRLDNSLSNNLIGSTVSIMESGYRNLQSVKVGNYVSLDNPLEGNSMGSLFTDIYSKMSSGSVQDLNTYISECDTFEYNYSGIREYLNFPYQTNQEDLTFFFSTQVRNGKDTIDCDVELKLPSSHCETTSTGLNNGNPVTYYSYNFPWTTPGGSIVAGSLEKSSANSYKFKYSLNGSEYYVTMSSDCISLGCPFNVLHASATELSDLWTYDYQDLGNPLVSLDYDPTHKLTLTASVGNDYAFGRRGKWKAYRSWVNQVDRQQKGNEGSLSEIDRDGEYNTFRYYNWETDTTKNQKNNWDWTNLMTKYSPYGYDLENKNPLHIYSSELYGYDNSLVTAVGANANYNEIAFDNIETGNDLTSGHHTFTGHFKKSVGTIGTTSRAHTGKKALSLSNYTEIKTNNLEFQKGKEYLLSFWVLTEGADDFNFSISDQGGGTPLETYHYEFNTNKAPTVEGFTKIDILFTNTTSDMSGIKIGIQTGGNGDCIMDDLRIQPSNSALKSYVYDPNTLKLIAELDNLNFATFYNYDKEGKLVQVKKATPKGVFTVKGSGDNIAH